MQQPSTCMAGGHEHCHSRQSTDWTTLPPRRTTDNDDGRRRDRFLCLDSLLACARSGLLLCLYAPDARPPPAVGCCRPTDRPRWLFDHRQPSSRLARPPDSDRSPASPDSARSFASAALHRGSEKAATPLAARPSNSRSRPSRACRSDPATVRPRRLLRPLSLARSLRAYDADVRAACRRIDVFVSNNRYITLFRTTATTSTSTTSPIPSRVASRPFASRRTSPRELDRKTLATYPVAATPPPSPLLGPTAAPAAIQTSTTHRTPHGGPG